MAAVVVEAEPGGRRRSGDRRARPSGGGLTVRGCLVLALLFSRPSLANCRLLLPLPITGSPAGISIVFWSPIGKEGWTRSSLAREPREPIPPRLPGRSVSG